MRQYILVCLAIVLMASISMCTHTGNGINPEPSPTNFTPPSNNYNGLAETVVIIPAGGGEIARDVCEAKGIDRSVIALYMAGCPACAITIPRLREVTDIDVEFEFLDFAAQEDQERINELKLYPEKIPTVVIGCVSYVGVWSAGDYRKLIEAI